MNIICRLATIDTKLSHMEGVSEASGEVNATYLMNQSLAGAMQELGFFEATSNVLNVKNLREVYVV